MKFLGATVSALALLLLLVLELSPASNAAIQCKDVISDLAPCTAYLRSGSGSPSASCCNGVSTLASAASTTADRRAACTCLVNAAQSIKPVAAAAQGLAGSCGFSLPYTMSTSIDCSKIT